MDRGLARTTISMPAELLDAIDAHCEKIHQDRSGYIRQVVQIDLDRHREQSALLNLLSEAQASGVNVESLISSAIRKAAVSGAIDG
tara:strand:+ start:11273 stop:11530 length:258 start_codon:yes stop_codon:yes gene_type:complete